MTAPLPTWDYPRPREQAVLDARLDGLTYDETAARLGISPHTVKVHLRNAAERLGLAGHRALMAWWVRQKLDARREEA